jgi:hypothetical protein
VSQPEEIKAESPLPEGPKILSIADPPENSAQIPDLSLNQAEEEKKSESFNDPALVDSLKNSTQNPAILDTHPEDVKAEEPNA